MPFGFRAGLSAEYKDATNFVGYPELVGKDRGLEVINAACPGETTASFLDVTAQSNGCENRPRVGLRVPRHLPAPCRLRRARPAAAAVRAGDAAAQ